MSLLSGWLNGVWGQTLARELACGGVREVVVCPGSRSAPLVLGADAEPSLRLWPIYDERSAAFFALGMAKASGRPVALIATSGSAAGHFLPAVMEAAHGGVPLVLLTADRPPELHGWGAPQTTRQERLYGDFAPCISLPLPEEGATALLHLRAEMSRALAMVEGAGAASGLGPGRGPVQVNVPFREPLAPPAAFASKDPVPAPCEGDLVSAQSNPPLLRTVRSGGALAQNELDSLVQRLRGKRGLLVAGPRDADDGLGLALSRLARTWGWPLLAEASSGCRYVADSRALRLYDTWLRPEAVAEALRPEVVLKVGGGLTSKVLQGWLDRSGAWIAQLGGGRVFDPAHAASTAYDVDPVGLCRDLFERDVDASPGWLKRFETVERAASEALTSQLARGTSTDAARVTSWGTFGDAAQSTSRGAAQQLDGPTVAAQVVAALPEDAVLFVSSSMPIREVDTFASSRRAPLRVLANRGLNGIDGLPSSAAGVAASTGGPTVLLTGDLAFLHDVNGLWAARTFGLDLTVVVVNNDGGGIFHHLPVAERIAPSAFERLFAVPHGVDLERAAALFDADFARVSTVDGLSRELRRALMRPSTEGSGARSEAATDAGTEAATGIGPSRASAGGLRPRVIEVRITRADGVARHRALVAAAVKAVEEAHRATIREAEE